MNKKKKFSIYGNCQAFALAQQLLKHQEFRDKYEYIHIDPCFSISAEETTRWIEENSECLDLLIAQDLKPGWRTKNPIWDIDSIKKALKIRGKLLRYSDIYFRFENPFLVYPRSFDRLPHCDYLDIISLTVYSHGFNDPDLCVELYNTIDLIPDAQLSAIHNLSELELSKREAGLEIQCSPELSALTITQPSFFTFNHPSSDALDILAKKVLSNLNISGESINGISAEALNRVKFPLPASVQEFYKKSSHTFNLNKNFDVDRVTIEEVADMELSEYFRISLKALNTVGITKACQELHLHRQNGISSIVISAIERSISDRLAISTSTLRRIGQLNEHGITPNFLLEKANPQAIGFMIDLIGIMRNTLLPRHDGEHLSILDLGAKTAAGSELLGQIGQPGAFSKLKFSVTCADIDPSFQCYSSAANKHVEYVSADVFELGRKWDIVICSHVIEHVHNPFEFIDKLYTIANKYIILAFPFDEDPKNLIPGHIHSLGHDFLRNIKPSHYVVYDGIFWSQSFCCIAVLTVNKS